MGKYTNSLQQARKDIDHCLNVWKNLLTTEFQDRISYIYAKGSAIKPWQSAIDYVPILSDVDIHIKVKDHRSLFHGEQNALNKSLEISQKYEELFTRNAPDALHLPRTQLVIINQLLEAIDYIPPRIQDVQIVLGKPENLLHAKPDRIREIDYMKLLETRETLERLPMSLLDLSGLDYWALLRRNINWRVSPTPFRLLTQVSDITPDEIWSWNRTRITQELQNCEYDQLADHYKQYYLTGWKAFLSHYQDSRVVRQIIYHGINVLSLSYQALQALNMSPLEDPKTLS